MPFNKLVHLLLASLVTARRPRAAQKLTLPLPMVNGSTPIIETVGTVPLDGLYITEPNATSYEWWYFDVVSEDYNSSVVFVTFLTYSETGAPGLSAELTISYPNGTWTEITIPQDELHFSTIGEGSIGVTDAFSWRSAPDLSEYTIQLDVEAQGVTGEINMASVAPPHVKCGPAVEGASLADAEHILWINPVPDAVASVNIEVNGTSMSFKGSGYHDKNWGTNSYADVLNQWYWGHGRSGPYSVVFFWIIQDNGEIVASAYLTQHDQIIYSTCDPDSVVIRPFGTEGIVYPVPFNGSASLKGLYVNIDAGEDIGQFAFTTLEENVIQTDGNPSTYRRWIGSFTGGLQGRGRENSSGSALWEQMGPFS
ncbi:Hydroxyneurosporene dehydrogenase [Cytospora mali]|uniref:Hydroxyneurosporene dehydrogenase n=1 Tax=Cytospora mali TaxID=578113 RepID=A0A194WA79_CYTMA|nr:Hydroxyneurosporene dehydrogenase [Valsa mali]